MGGGKGPGLFSGTRGSGVNVRGQNFEIHQGRQNKHITGTNNHSQEVRQGRTPSRLTTDAHNLFREFAGRGERKSPNREVVDAGRTIGQFFCTKRQQFFETTRFTIHYDSRGNAHIVPSMPSWMMPQ